MSWEDHESKRQATAGGAGLCLHFILHNFSFILAAQRLAVRWSDWLDLLMRLKFVWVMSLGAPLKDGEIRTEEEHAGDHQYATSGKEPSRG